MPRDDSPRSSRGTGGRRSLRFTALFALAPGERDHRVAFRAALGVFLPLVALIAIDRLDLAVFAIFGAFTGVYGRVEGHRNRLEAQLRAGALFWVVILGAWLSSARLVDHASGWGPWAVVGLTTAVAWSCSLATAYLRIRPAGSLFHIFAFAAIASQPRLPPLGEAMSATSATMLLAVAIGLASWLPPRSRTPWRRVRTPAAPTDHRAVWLDSVGYLLGAGIAGTVATLLSPAWSTEHTYWAMVAAVVPLVGRTTRHRVVRGVHRILGTIAGLAVMAVIVLAAPSPWVAALVIGLMQFGAEMLITRNYFWAQVFVTPLALVGTSLAAGFGPGLLRDRMLETLVGAAVGVCVVLAGSAWGGRAGKPGAPAAGNPAGPG
ncbi:FUSC family protein [Arthrobacter halodurans]|uniref:FUSC family protein n=1 Tax=Arthrobacter halodurans TaxID=516699 RepID=A0ABV4UMV2_9MICC